MWLGHEVAAGGGDLRRAEAADHPDGGVAEGGHRLRGVAGAHGGAVLVEGHVADVVQLVLDGPVAAPQRSSGAGLARCGGSEVTA